MFLYSSRKRRMKVMKFSINRLLSMIKKELIQVKRDRPTLAMLLILPVLQLVLFGYAINTEVKNLKTLIIDPNPSKETREIYRAFENTQYYKISGFVSSYDEMIKAIDAGDAQVGLVFPVDFTQNIRSGRIATLQLIVDASDPLASRSAISAAQSLGQYYAFQLASKRLLGNVELPLEIRTRGWYNPDMKSSQFMVPGIIGVIVTLVTMIITALSLVREKERGTLEQLKVTPISRWEIIIGKLIPPFLISYLDLTIALILAKFMFGVAFKGNILNLYLLTFPYLLIALGLGLFISTIATNQMQAFQASFFFFLPSIMLSGFMFPIDAMPWIVQQITKVIPLTYYLRIIRGVIVKGVGMGVLKEEAIILTIMGLVTIYLSARRVGRKLV
jgi:ABC-2 type transport system permease protein